VGYLKRDIIQDELRCVSRNIFRTCKADIEAGGQPYDLSIKQDLFNCGRGVGNQTQNSGRSCLIRDNAPVTAAKLREKA